MCAIYFTEKNEISTAEEYQRQYQFYSWIPSFCEYIPYNPENVSILAKINSGEALEQIETILVPDLSKRSTELLAAICYHHYHGPVENRAFEELERRGKDSQSDERDFIGSILMYLLENQRSFCTIKGAANALAGMKHDQLFEILVNLLPQDVSI
jgi:hypothetical protein